VFNLGSKSFFGMSAFCFMAAVVYAFAGSDIAGFTLLLLADAALVGLGMAALAGTGGADRFALAQSEQSSADHPTIAPFLGAVGLGFTALSIALGAPALAAGAVVATLAAFMWFGAAWRSHPDMVAAMRPRIADRFNLPILMPVAVIGIIAITAISISRSLLATSKTGSWILAGAIGVVIFGALMIWAWKPANKVISQFLVIVAVIAVVTLAVLGLAAGERSFHEGEHEAALAVSTR
jgi:hypothetical protein